MPRDKSHSLCMLCGNSPCTCFEKPKPAKKATKRATKSATPKQDSTPVPVPDQPNKADPLAAMRAAAASAAHSPAPQYDRRGEVVERDSIEPVDISDDPELTAAVSALGPILHRDEKIRYAAALTPQARAAAWKARRQGGE